MTANVTEQNWFERRPWIDDPEASIEAYVNCVARPEDYDLKGKLEHWRECGIVTFEGAVDTGKIDALLADVEYLVHHPANFAIDVEKPGELHCPIKQLSTSELLESDRLKINNLHTVSKAALRCALNKFVSSFLQHIFQDNPCILQSLFFIKGSQQPIHLDYPYVNCQEHIANLAASWLALEDVHADSGPLAYYCGSHSPERLPFFDWGTGSITYSNDAPRNPQDFSNYLADEMRRLSVSPEVFLPKKGDMLIWHAYLAHEGTGIKDFTKSRKSLVTHYTCKNSYPRLHKYNQADEEGRFYAENGGIHYDPPWTEGWEMLPSWRN